MAECFLLFYFLTLEFRQKWYFPQGEDVVPTVMQIYDTDRDGYLEFIFTTYGNWPDYLYFYELHLPDDWIIDSFLLPSADLLWDSGDFDNDGLYDLLFQFHTENPSLADGIMVFESPDSFSYPTQEVWRDTVEIGTVQPICAYDIDRDGIPEVMQTAGELGQNYYIDFSIYESSGNNIYELKYQFESPETPTSTIAFGDFDRDALNEFVLGTIDGQYSIFESPMNDIYVPLFVNLQLPTLNIKDCFTVPDADGDGKLEFVVKGFIVPDARTDCFIFEATGDNTYQVIKSFHLPNSMGWWYGGGYSDVGDIDGDSVPEIALEAAYYVYLIKCGGNDSFYVWQTLYGYGHPEGSCVRVFDIDGNGLNEIIISGGNQTRIYEKTPFVTWFCPEPYDTFYASDTVYPRWKLDETIALDSLRLYWAHPQLGCHLIYQGLSTDTICQWVVPDTQSNMSNRFWLVTKGFGRYDSTYSPVFYIKRHPGIEETTNSKFEIRNPNLAVYPNPFRNHLVIQYAVCSKQYAEIKEKVPTAYSLLPTIHIYDATGRLVRQWDYQTIRLSDQIVWSGDDDSGCQLSPGVYFVCLRNGSLSAIKKVIKLGG